MRKFFALALFSLLFFQFKPAHTIDTSQYLMRIKATNKFERSVIANTGVAIEGAREDYVLAIGNLAEKNRIERLGWLLEATPMSELKDFPIADREFHNYSEMKDALIKMEQDFPNQARVFSIGKTWLNRDILGIRISADLANASKKPAIAYMGGHHSREHLSVELPLRFAQYLLSQYKAGNDRIVRLLNSRDVQIVPAVNPDGLEYDISDSNYKFWRKNRRKNDDGTYGVDLNRNYGYDWGTGGSSSSPDSDVYMGPAPFSEPETQAVKKWIEDNNNITILLSFHTYSELILYPWGHSYDGIPDPRDKAVHETMAKKIAEWNHYKPEQTSDLYIASGDITDWAYGQHKIISFTFELDPGNEWGGGGFYPGAQIIQSVVDKNIEPCLYLLEYADNPYRVLDTSPEASIY